MRHALAEADRASYLRHPEEPDEFWDKAQAQAWSGQIVGRDLETCSYLFQLVGLRRFELPTFGPQTDSLTKLRHSL